MALTESQIQELYIAYFGRPADVEGKNYWSGPNAGVSTQAEFAAIMHAQSEFQDTYGSLSTANQVEQIYQNLFNRAADATGLAYWTGQIADGTLKLAEIATHLIWAAKNVGGGAADAAVLANKRAAAIDFTTDVEADATAQLAYTASNETAFTTGQTFINSVSTAAATAAQVDEQIATIKADAGAKGTTYALTTAADAIVGTVNNDTINGVMSSTATLDTFSNLDSIDGGDGSDTFSLILQTDGGAATSHTFPVVSISNVETLKIKNQDADSDQAFTIDLGSISGLTKVVSDLSTAKISLTNVSNLTSVDVTGNGGSNGATADLALAYKSDSTSSTVNYKDGFDGGDLVVTGVVTSQTIGSSGAQNDIDAITLASTTTSLTIDASSKFVTSGALDFGDTQKLVVTGTAAVDLDAALLDASTNEVDASGSSGGVSVHFADVSPAATVAGKDVADITFTGGSGNDSVKYSADTDGLGNHELSISTGGGNDTVKLESILAASTASKVADILNGGDGTDTLLISASNAELQGAVTTVSNFEELTITDSVDSTVTVGNFQSSGLTTVNLKSAVVANGITFATGGGTIDLETTGTLGYDGFLVTVAGSATTDTVTLRNQAKSGANHVNAFGDYNIVATGVETLIIDTAGEGTSSTAVTQDIGTITMTPTSPTGTTTYATVKFKGGNNDVSVEAIDAYTIDASDMTKAFVMTAAFTSDNSSSGAIATLTGGSGNDELVGDADQAQTITGGAGNDTINGGSAKDTIYGGDGNDIIGGDSKVAVGTGSGKDVVEGGAGNDTITLGGTALVTIDGGAGNDTVNAAGNLTNGQTITGGAGTDELIVNATETLATASVVSGFEELDLDDVDASQDLDLYANNTFTTIDIGSASGMVLTSVRSEVIKISAAIAADSTITMEDATGSADSASFKITGSSNIDTGEELIVASVETINIESDDTATTAANRVHTFDLQADSATSIVITGDSGLIFATGGGTDIADVTSMDASGVVQDKVTRTGITYAATYNTAGNTTTIKGSNAIDTLTGGSATNDTITAGSGADVITYGGGADSYTLGAGDDHVNVNADGTKTAHLVITDAVAGDQLDFTSTHNGTLSSAAMGTAISLSSGTTESLDNYLDAATTGDGSSNSIAKWFQFSGSTYVVLDNTATNGYATTDTIVELTGTINLKTSEIASDILTLV